MVDVRVLLEGSPEARLAAVCVGICRSMGKFEGRTPDYADFRDGLRDYVMLEILLARLAECRVPEQERAAHRSQILKALGQLEF